MLKPIFKTKKKIDKLLVTFFALVLLLNIFPISTQRVSAQGFTFPKLGSSSLADSEWYEKANILQKAALFLTSYTPARTETFDKTYYGFSLSGDFEGVVLRIKKGNDTYTEYLKVGGDETLYGNDTSFDTTKTFTSDLFIFTEGVKEVEFYYEGQKNFSINKYAFQESPKTGSLQLEEFASTNAEVAYKKKLFSQMGFNLITREEWGAPTSSPWAPTIANVNRIVIHHTATSVDMANPKNTVMAVYNYHYYRCANNAGSYNPDNPDPNCDEPSEWWTDVGYNYMIDPYGNIYEGRSGGNGVVGAHAIPNTGSIGISILGNYVSQDPTQASMEALTRLVSALSQLNNFNAVWHGGDPKSGTGLYGHRDLMPTACPARIYDRLPTVASTAIQIKPINSTLGNVDSKRNALINNREYQVEGTKARVILDSTKLTALTKEKLLTRSRGVERVTQMGNSIVYTVDNSKIDQLLAETLLVAPESNAQPNFLYKLESWDNTSPTRSIPSDYDPTTHWNDEKIKLPEAWKEMGGCTSDNSCGGDPSVVVAVLDTGLAYENSSYDAGDDDSYSVGRFGGIYIEYPTNSTQDGTFVNGSYQGYERQYNQSSEMGGVNIVSPYDAVQDFFCDLRTLDTDPSNDCNTNELAKINHPNDDYGHGTLVTTIIAGKTGDAAPNKVVGIAHNVSIMPIKVFYPNDRSMCQDSLGNLDLTCSNSTRDYRVVGDSYVISNAIYYAVANGADVINMSLRGIGTDPMMKAAVDYAVSSGVVVVAAAGNDSSDIANYYPASFENVIAVGAVKSDNTRATYSNYGEELDIVAPVGESDPKIVSQSYSCYPSKNDCSDEANAAALSSFTSSSTPIVAMGTSFAAPQVSAAVALAKTIKPTITQSEALRVLTDTATDVEATGRDNNTGYGVLNINEAISNIWLAWDPPSGEAQSEITMVLFGSSLYQAVRGLNSKIYTRSSSDGINWGTWIMAPGETADEIQMAVFNGKLYQAIKGTNNKTYTRSTLDGTNWSDWIIAPGETASNVNMIVFGTNLYQAIRGTNNRIYTRYSPDGTNWTSWYTQAGETLSNISMVAFGGKLFQAIRGTNNRIYTRDSTGGTNWTVWRNESGETLSDVNMLVYNGNLYQALRGTNNRIYTRFSADGTNWSSWTSQPGETAGNVHMEAFDNKIYQAIRGTNNGVYTRFSGNGTTWSYWMYSDETLDNITISSVNLGSGNKLFEARRGTDNKVYTRHLQ